MLKLIFIGDKRKDTFKISSLGTCRFFYEISYNNVEDVKGYLKEDHSQLSSKELEFLNKNSNTLFVCLDNKCLYFSNSSKLYIFDIHKFEQDKKRLIVSEVEERKPIPMEAIIATKDKDIVNMMRKRGCKVLEDKKEGYLILPEVTLIGNKRFCDNLIIKSISDVSKIKTRTGLEKTIKITIKDEDTKKNIVCPGKLVNTFRQNKSYVVFNFNGDDTYFEIWFDKDGEVMNDWQKENHESLKGKNQSNRIYYWNI